MRIIPIWNSIKPQSLRCRWFNATALLLLFVISGCNRIPDACVEVSKSRVQLGENLVIRDCSKRSFNNELKMGDGSSFSDIDNKTWFYTTPGHYFVSLKAFSRKGTKSETATQEVHVVAPDSNSLKARWKVTRIELREQLFVDPNINVYSNLLVSADTLDEIYSIRGDSLFVQHNINEYHLFLNEYRMSYNTNNASLKVGDFSFDIVSYSGNNMVWSGYYFKGYSLLYLERINDGI